jgi:hypothetical protein
MKPPPLRKLAQCGCRSFHALEKDLGSLMRSGVLNQVPERVEQVLAGVKSRGYSRPSHSRASRIT